MPIEDPIAVTTPEMYELRYSFVPGLGLSDAAAIVEDARRRGAPELALVEFVDFKLIPGKQLIVKWSAHEGNAPHEPVETASNAG